MSGATEVLQQKRSWGSHVAYNGLFTLLNKQLSVITYAITCIVSRILYVFPAWRGFLSVELKNKVDAFFKSLKRFGYLDCVFVLRPLMI